MIEGNDNGGNLVRVRAQVMMRDDSTGGWVPMGGGGLSNVSVRRRLLKQPTPEDSKPEYFIHGKRISDQTVILSCTIKKDFQYNKVMPTFHHWITGSHKFGLTFQTAADARAFDKGVRIAVDDILEGFHDLGSTVQSHFCCHSDVVDEDDVFMAVDLPVDRDGSRSSTGSATTGSSGSRKTPTSFTPVPCDHSTTLSGSSEFPLNHHLHHHFQQHFLHHQSVPIDSSSPSTTFGCTAITNVSPASTLSYPKTISSSVVTHHPHSAPGLHHQHLQRITYLPRHSKPPAGSGVDIEKRDLEKIQVLGESYSYVQFAKAPLSSPQNTDHCYPPMHGHHKGERRDSIASLKKHHQALELVGSPGSIPTSTSPFHADKKPKKRLDRGGGKTGKLRCKYCQDSFTEERNKRGSCEFAPDCVQSAIDRVTCISCAECMIYHCMSDSEGEFLHHPCECQFPIDRSCGSRWLGLTLLSLVVPCLLCYLPLKACHKCAVACSLCGGKHDAS